VVINSGTNANNYAIDGEATGAGTNNIGGYFVASGATNNTGGYFSASGGTNNYGLIVASGLVGIGTTSPYAKLSVAGNAVVTDNLTSSYFTATSTTATSTFQGTVLAQNGGSVGIGTTTPGNAAKLGVAGNLFVGGSATSTFANGINLAAGCFSVNGVCVGGNTSQWTTASSNIYYTTGNVGIGTTSPYAALSVAGSVAVDDNVLATSFIATSTTATSTFAGKVQIGTGLHQNSALSVIGDMYINGKQSIIAGSFSDTGGNVSSITGSIVGISGGAGTTTVSANSGSSVAVLASIGDLVGTSNTLSKSGSSGANALYGTFNSIDNSAGTVNNVYGAYSKITAFGGTQTNTYGFYSDVQSGTNQYSFYGKGPAQSYFGGNVGIGSTTPGLKLSVAGSSLFDDYVQASTFNATSTTATSTFSGGLTIGKGVNAGSYLYGAGLSTSCAASGDKLLWSNGVFSCGADAGAGGGITAIGAQYSSFQTGSSQTFATSSDTNLQLTITSSGDVHTFAPAWSGTLAVSRGGTGLGSVGASSTVLLSNGTGLSYYKLSPANFTTSNISQWTNDAGYLTGATQLAYPFGLTGNATSTLTQFNGGLTAYASSTIGNGTRTGGLTINGGATTTGVAYFGSNVGIGTSTPSQQLSLVNTTSGFLPAMSLDSGTNLTGYARYGFYQNTVYKGGLDFNKSTGDLRLNTPSNTDALTILNTGKVGIGTSTPSATLSVQGDGLFSGQVSLSNLTATGTLTAASNFYVLSDGSVGIGTSSFSGSALAIQKPTASLAGLRVTANGDGGSGTKGAILWDGADGTPLGILGGENGTGSYGTFSLKGNSALNGGRLAEWNIMDRSISGDQRAITLSGDYASASGDYTLGIIGGNSATLSLTHDALRVYNTTGVGSSTPSAGITERIAFNNITNSFTQRDIAALGAIMTQSGASYQGALAFYTATSGTAPSEKVRIDNNGKFGIGTTTPIQTLSVQGSALISGNLSLANLIATGTATTTNLAVTSVTSALLKANAQGQLVAAVAGTDYLTSSNLFAYPFPAGATSTLVAFNGGLTASSVGIGTSTPSSTLGVQGNGLFSGNLTAANITATGTLTVLSTTATSTFGNGINITKGCFAINGSCVGGSGGGGTVNSGTTGQVAYYAGNGTAVTGTSTLTFATNGLSTFAGPVVIQGTPITGGDGALAVYEQSGSADAIYAESGLYAAVLAASATGYGGAFSGPEGSVYLASGSGFTSQFTGSTVFEGNQDETTVIIKAAAGQSEDLISARSNDSLSSYLQLAPTYMSVDAGAFYYNFADNRFTTSYASTTALTANTLCIGTSCRTSWPNYYGASAGTTWSTTTSQVAGQLMNYSNNATDIVAIGGTATTTAPFWFNPNNTTGYIAGNLGIGTTSPYAKLSVAGQVVGSYFTSTSTTASTFPYASTTALTVAGNAYINGTSTMQTASTTYYTDGNRWVKLPELALTRSYGKFNLGTTSPREQYNYYLAFQTDNLSARTQGDSGIAYWQNRGTVLIINNNNHEIYEYTPNGEYLLRTITLTNFTDEEDIVWMYDDTFAILDENESNITITTINATQTTLDQNAAGNTVISFAGTVGTGTNVGAEGLGYDPDRDLFWIVKEKTSASIHTVTRSGVVTTPFTLSTLLTAAGSMTDASAIYFDRNTQHIFIASDEGTSDRIIEADTSGNLVTYMIAPTAFGQLEGLTFSPDGEQMWLSGEADDFARYEFQRPNSTFAIIGTMDAGKIGIGTTSPYAALSVVGPSGVVADKFFATSTTATSTFAWGVQANALNILSTTATSTFANGIQLSGGCFSVNGSCLGGAGGGSGTVSSGVAGQFAFYSAGGTTVSGSSVLTTANGNIGIGTTTPYAALSVVGASGVVAEKFTATSTTATSTIAGGFTAGGTNGLLVFGGNGNVGIGSSSPTSKLTIGKTDGLASTSVQTVGINEYFTMNLAGAGTQFGNSMYIVNAPTINANVMVGEMFRVEDNTSLANTVRGLEVQANRGSNTQGENTGISAFGRTFGIRGISEGDAGGFFLPAGVFAQTRGTTQGNALRAYSGTITSSDLAYLYQDTSTFTGNALLIDAGTSGSFTGNFINLKKSGITKFLVDDNGTTTIGDGSTQAGLQIGFGGLCVDNDGSCTASTSGRISAVQMQTANSDLAEMYFSDDELSPGEIVSTQGSYTIGRATGANKNAIIGVVSTKPGLLLGFDDVGTANAGYPVALTGRVPVKVSTEGGSIKAGDKIILSSIDGIGMKMSGEGMMVGVALEDFDGTKATGDAVIDQLNDNNEDPTPAEKIVIEDDPCYVGGPAAVGDEPCERTSTEERTRVITDTKSAKKVSAASVSTHLEEQTTKAEEMNVKIGTIQMFVSLGWARLDSQVASLGTSTLSSAWFVDTNTGEMTTDYFTHEDFKGIAFNKIRSIGGFNNKWSIDENGKVTAEIVEAKTVRATEALEVGTQSRPSGITIYDTVTGEPYCMQMASGAMVSVKGICGEVTVPTTEEEEETTDETTEEETTSTTTPETNGTGTTSTSTPETTGGDTEGTTTPETTGGNTDETTTDQVGDETVTPPADITTDVTDTTDTTSDTNSETTTTDTTEPAPAGDTDASAPAAESTENGSGATSTESPSTGTDSAPAGDSAAPATE
jgi:uncharacterized protein YjiK